MKTVELRPNRVARVMPPQHERTVGPGNIVQRDVAIDRYRCAARPGIIMCVEVDRPSIAAQADTPPRLASLLIRRPEGAPSSITSRTRMSLTPALVSRPVDSAPVSAHTTSASGR